MRVSDSNVSWLGGQERGGGLRKLVSHVQYHATRERTLEKASTLKLSKDDRVDSREISDPEKAYTYVLINGDHKVH